jgi:hypothetical protein
VGTHKDTEILAGQGEIKSSISTTAQLGCPGLNFDLKRPHKCTTENVSKRMKGAG